MQIYNVIKDKYGGVYKVFAVELVVLESLILIVFLRKVNYNVNRNEAYKNKFPNYLEQISYLQSPNDDSIFECSLGMKA